MQSPPSVRPSVRLFPLCLRNRLAVDFERLHVMFITHTRLEVKVKVKVMVQAKAAGPTSIDGDFFQLFFVMTHQL